MPTILANISLHLPPINLNLHNLNKVVLKKVELYTPGCIPIFRMHYSYSFTFPALS